MSTSLMREISVGMFYMKGWNKIGSFQEGDSLHSLPSLCHNSALDSRERGDVGCYVCRQLLPEEMPANLQ